MAKLDKKFKELQRRHAKLLRDEDVHFVQRMVPRPGMFGFVRQVALAANKRGKAPYIPNAGKGKRWEKGRIVDRHYKAK